MTARFRTTAAIAALAIALAGCSTATKSNTGGGGGSGSKKVTIKLGVVDFTEQQILGQVYAQVLQKAGFTVQTQKVASREVAAPALKSGKLDMLLEYAGSDLTFLTKQTPSADAEKVFNDLKTFYASQQVTTLDQAPMSDQQGIAVTQAISAKYHLKTLSDLGNVSSPLVIGGPPECKDRITCFKGLQQTYGFKSVSFKSIEGGGLKYSALSSNQIQVALVFTTDGQIAKQHLVLLTDDKHLFPPDHLVPVVRNDLLAKAGSDFTSTVNKVSALITTEEITGLNAKVDLDKQDPDQVATDWLKGKGLL